MTRELPADAISNAVPVVRALVVIPTLNEVETIADVLADLDYGSAAFPIVVADGGSSDDTRKIVAHIMADHPHIRLVDNPGRTQAHATNAAAGLAHAAGAAALVRVDAHARYPKGFVEGVVRLLDEKAADSVTTQLIARQDDGWRGRAGQLQRSWLGTGGAAHRHVGQSGWVDNGHHAAFRLKAFRALGGYDTVFVANEDAEFDVRLRRAGGRIWLTDRWPVAYVPRQGPTAIFRQMLRNGRWRIATARKHHQPLRFRQLAPITVTTAVAAATAVAPFQPFALIVPLSYLAAVGALALQATRGSVKEAVGVAWLAILSHLGFGFGALHGAWLGLWRPDRP